MDTICEAHCVAEKLNTELPGTLRLVDPAFLVGTDALNVFG